VFWGAEVERARSALRALLSAEERGSGE